MKKINWILTNALFAVFLYFGFYKDIEGAKNCFIFLTWFYFVLSIAANSDVVQESKKKKSARRIVPEWLDSVVNMIFILILVWFSAWFTAIGFTIQTIAFMAAHDKLEKES